ncbi:phospholipase A [Sulfurimonas sp.]
MKYLVLFILLHSLVYADDIVSLFSNDETKVQIDTSNIPNDTSKENMEIWLKSVFGLQPYRENYILPFGYANKRYESKIPFVKYDNKEAEIQISLKLKVTDNLMGLNEKYFMSYTQHAFWQIYTYSAPFRESLYNPEGFVIFPVEDENSMFHLRSVKVAIAHKSNGQPNTEEVAITSPGTVTGNLSKSINYFYTTIRLQHTTLITDITFLAPFPGTDNLSDNPDLMDYLGYNEVKFTYFYNDHMFTLMGRGNIATGKGAVEATYSYPLRKDKSYLYMKIFSGYVESLIDYNKNITKFAIGFSFSR